MINRKSLVFFLIFILLSNCSFDKKTGIWEGSKEEKEKISELEKRQKEIIDTYKAYSSENIFSSFLENHKLIIFYFPNYFDPLFFLE